MDKDEKIMKERRRFYRIDDSVILNYMPFPEEQIDEAISRIEMLKSQHKLLQNSLGSIELRLDYLLEEISEPLPEIAEALKIINRKLSILSQFESPTTESALGLSMESMNSEVHEVNMSGSGLAFSSPASFFHGEIMEIEFSLLPEYYNVRAIGKVVECRELTEIDPEKKYKVAVDFIYLKEADREIIVAHILKKQGEELKNQRELHENDEADLDAMA